MKERSFNQNGDLWYGLARTILVTIILLLGALLFYVSSKYFDFSDDSGYLSNRPSIFFRFSVILHLVSASILLLITTILIFFRIEKKWPNIHSKFGKTTVIIGLFLLVPTGFYLSCFAMGGILGNFLFFGLTVLTLLSLINAYRSAVKKKFMHHKRWMIRFYILLTSALWLRLNMFVLFYFFSAGEWQYLTATFLSWAPQLILFEIYSVKKR